MFFIEDLKKKINTFSRWLTRPEAEILGKLKYKIIRKPCFFVRLESWNRKKFPPAAGYLRDTVFTTKYLDTIHLFYA